MSKETFRFDVVLRVEIDADEPLNPLEVGAIAAAVGTVLSPYSPARDAVVVGLDGCLAFAKERGKLNAWFELPWEEHEEVT